MNDHEIIDAAIEALTNVRVFEHDHGYSILGTHQAEKVISAIRDGKIPGVVPLDSQRQVPATMALHDLLMKAPDAQYDAEGTGMWWCTIDGCAGSDHGLADYILAAITAGKIPGIEAVTAECHSTRAPSPAVGGDIMRIVGMLREIQDVAKRRETKSGGTLLCAELASKILKELERKDEPAVGGEAVEVTDKMARIVLAKYFRTNYHHSDMQVADMKEALTAALGAFLRGRGKS